MENHALHISCAAERASERGIVRDEALVMAQWTARAGRWLDRTEASRTGRDARLQAWKLEAPGKKRVQKASLP
jgi:hypothetical protein